MTDARAWMVRAASRGLSVLLSARTPVAVQPAGMRAPSTATGPA